jgi:hypothetical protein
LSRPTPDGLLDVLTNGRDAVIVPKRNARALAEAIVAAMDDPGARTRLSAEARRTGQQYDITLFVRKMETALRPSVRHVAEDRPARCPRHGSVLSDVERVGMNNPAGTAAPFRDVIAARQPLDWFLLLVGVAMAVTIDPVPSPAPGMAADIKSDEAVYVAASLSAAYDGNLSFERRDLERFDGTVSPRPVRGSS